jgi:hypothetical protein
MRVIDLMAWAEALNVPFQEVPTALRHQERQVSGLCDEVMKTWGGLREAPDEELLIYLGAAGRGLSQVADQLATTAADAAREVG